MSDTASHDRDGRCNALERFLSLFAQVRAGEGLLVVLLTATIFLLLTSYYLLKVVREPLILLGGAFGLNGALLKAAAAAGQAALLLALIPAYSMLADRVSRIRLINYVSGIFIASFAIFHLLAVRQVPIGLAFFVWLGIFNMMVIAQFWSFANDLYTEEQGKRLFAIVAFGGTSGAVVGAALGGVLARNVGLYQLILVAAVLLVICALLTNIVHRLDLVGRRQNQPVEGHAQHDQDQMGKAGGFGLVLRRPYLRLIALMILTYNTVNTNGEFILGQIVSAKAYEDAAAMVPKLRGPERAQAINERAGKIIGGFYGNFFTYVNLLTGVIQLLFVSRIFKYLGVRFALFVLPVIAVGGYAAVSLLPLLKVLKVGKILENSTDYSLQNTTRQALFLPTTREEKYKAKAAIDTFFVRFGDVISFGLVYFITRSVGLGPRGVAGLNVGLIALWIAFVIGISHHHSRLSEQP